MFSPRFARRSLRRYRSKGLDPLERRMIASAREGGLEGVRVLEVGGGIGKLQAELLEAGAEQGEVIELVAAFEPYARELAREKGLEQRTSFRVADILDEGEMVTPADVVLLNRVVCCSPDGVQLAAAAARLTRRTLVLSFPRRLLAIRVAVAFQNLVFRMLGRSFRVFVHPLEAVVAAAESGGLGLVEHGQRGIWEFVAMRRPAEART
jgi:magnesium-protoporphyrin O-methyltransferase